MCTFPIFAKGVTLEYCKVNNSIGQEDAKSRIILYERCLLNLIGYTDVDFAGSRVDIKSTQLANFWRDSLFLGLAKSKRCSFINDIFCFFPFSLFCSSLLLPFSHVWPPPFSHIHLCPFVPTSTFRPPLRTPLPPLPLSAFTLHLLPSSLRTSDPIPLWLPLIAIAEAPLSRPPLWVGLLLKSLSWTVTGFLLKSLLLRPLFLLPFLLLGWSRQCKTWWN